MEIKKMKKQVIRGLLTPLRLQNVDAVAFHHMAHPTWNIYDVEYHHVMKNGWMAIGYNYFIDFDGNIFEGRGLNVAAGISGHNSHVISIGLQGDFENGYPTDKQYEACAELYKYLKNKIPSIKRYACHRDFNATACPGKNFNMEKITEILNKKENEKMEEKIYNWTTACPLWSQKYVHKALELGLISTDEKGNLNLTDEKIFLVAIAVRVVELLTKGE